MESIIIPLTSNINPLSSSITRLRDTEPVETPVQPTDDLFGLRQNFSDIFTETLNTAVSADWDDKTSAVELLSGQSDDMSGLLLDAQKAEIALNFSLQIRNKVLDAYNEVMRMQV